MSFTSLCLSMLFQLNKLKTTIQIAKRAKALLATVELDVNQAINLNF